MREERYFETLRLKPGASPEEIKRAYLAQVKRWHPDRFAHDPAQQKEAEERMKAINVAYEALAGEAKPEVPFQRGAPVPSYDSEAADASGRAAYAHQKRPTAFAFWRGQTGLLSWVGTIVLALISLGVCGLGFAWALVDKDRQFLHDRLAGTRLVPRTV